jgi:hypothetical protein
MAKRQKDRQHYGQKKRDKRTNNATICKTLHIKLKIEQQERTKTRSYLLYVYKWVTKKLNDIWMGIIFGLRFGMIFMSREYLHGGFFANSSDTSILTFTISDNTGSYFKNNWVRWCRWSLKNTPLSYNHSKVARIVTGLTCYANLDSVYKETGWEKLRTRQDVLKICMFYGLNVGKSLIPPCTLVLVNLINVIYEVSIILIKLQVDYSYPNNHSLRSNFEWMLQHTSVWTVRGKLYMHTFKHKITLNTLFLLYYIIKQTKWTVKCYWKKHDLSRLDWYINIIL